jgi:hypothetical protein
VWAAELKTSKPLSSSNSPKRFYAARLFGPFSGFLVSVFNFFLGGNLVMMRSLYSKVLKVWGLTKTVGSGDSTATVVDMKGFHSCLVNVEMGTFAFTTTNSAALILLDSTDNTTFGTCAFADIEGVDGTATFRIWDGTTTRNGGTSAISAYRGTKRYLKAVIHEAGTVSVPCAVSFTLGEMDIKPTIDAGH